jgi:hypothetical protein
MPMPRMSPMYVEGWMDFLSQSNLQPLALLRCRFLKSHYDSMIS